MDPLLVLADLAIFFYESRDFEACKDQLRLAHSRYGVKEVSHFDITFDAAMDLIRASRSNGALPQILGSIAHLLTRGSSGIRSDVTR